MGRGFSTAVVFAALVPALAWPSPAWSQDGCRELIERFDRALEGSDVAAIVAAAVPIRSVPDACSAPERTRVNREVAFAHVREAVRLGRGGEAPSRQLEILREGSRFARPWQLLAATADVSAEIKGPDGRPNYQQVARAYLDALDVGNNRNLTPAPPPKAVTARLLNRVHEMRALAKTFVPAGEVLTRAAGGVEVDVIPVPMKFHYKHPLPEKSNPDASDMTEEGRQYAIEAIGILKSLQNPRIRLVGHTDPIGGTAYNRALGQRRANAVRNFMVAQGYDPQFISIKSLGQERPIAIESTGLEDAERFEILRRVEICFVDKPNLSEACQ